MAAKSKPVTRLCWSDADQIQVRGKNLCTELVGKMSFTEMMLFHLMGTTPSPAQVAIVDSVLITIMEHGLTPSAIAARETYSGAPEALQGAVAAGILGVGSRFAGTSGDCAALLEEIVAAPKDKKADVARAIAQRFRDAKKPLPGFGHPVHKKLDPRVPRLVEIARAQGVEGKYIEAMYLLGDAVSEAAGRYLVINASAAMGAVMAEADIPPTIMRGLVIVSRAAGLVGHLLEEMQDPAAQLIWDLAEEHVPYSGT
jgi:citrate synthase